MRLTFGEQLLNERVRQNLTAEEAAKACGVSRSYITLMETGKRMPGTKNISKIAKALKIETGVVLNWYLEDIAQQMRKNLKVS